MTSNTPTNKAINVYVCGLPKTFKEKNLFDLFVRFGEISSVKILYDKIHEESKGIGFVKFKEYECAVRAISALNATFIQGETRLTAQPLQVRFAHNQNHQTVSNTYGPKGQSSNSQSRFHPYSSNQNEEKSKPNYDNKNNVYICGFPKTWSHIDLENHFKPYGAISSTRVLTTDTGEGRGVGFVRFINFADAVKAIDEQNHKTVGGDQMLQVRFAADSRDRTKQNQENKIAQLYSQYQGAMAGSTMPALPAGYQYQWVSLDPNAAAYQYYYQQAAGAQAYAYAPQMTASSAMPYATATAGTQAYTYLQQQLLLQQQQLLLQQPSQPPQPQQSLSSPVPSPPPPSPPPPPPGVVQPHPPQSQPQPPQPPQPPQLPQPSQPSQPSQPPQPQSQILLQPSPQVKGNSHLQSNSFPISSFNLHPQQYQAQQYQSQLQFPPYQSYMSGFQSNMPASNIAQASESSLDQKKEEKDKNSLFVLYLPPTFKDHDLQKLFQDYGEVDSVKVIMDHSTNFNKGYGFVNMKTRIGAKRAMVSLNGHRIGSKYLKVSIKTKKE